LIGAERSLAHLPDLDATFEGVEDVRLFSFDGALWGVCCRPISGTALSCGMSLMKLDADLRGAKAIPLASPYGFSREKNWLPIVRSADRQNQAVRGAFFAT
jgi:hypothetical protein